MPNRADPEALKAALDYFRPHEACPDYGNIALMAGSMREHLAVIEGELAALRQSASETGAIGRAPSEPGSCRSGEAADASSSLRDSDPSRAARPSPGLLMSMALRYDHSIGMPGRYDWKSLPGIGEKEVGRHTRMLVGTMITMGQLWQEATGNGFYDPAKESGYVAMAARCGVTFTEDGYPMAARVSDGSGEAGKTEGLDPKDDSAVGRQSETPKNAAARRDGGRDDA